MDKDHLEIARSISSTQIKPKITTDANMSPCNSDPSFSSKIAKQTPPILDGILPRQSDDVKMKLLPDVKQKNSGGRSSPLDLKTFGKRSDDTTNIGLNFSIERLLSVVDPNRSGVGVLSADGNSHNEPSCDCCKYLIRPNQHLVQKPHCKEPLHYQNQLRSPQLGYLRNATLQGVLPASSTDLKSIVRPTPLRVVLRSNNEINGHQLRTSNPNVGSSLFNYNQPQYHQSNPPLSSIMAPLTGLQIGSHFSQNPISLSSHKDGSTSNAFASSSQQRSHLQQQQQQPQLTDHNNEILLNKARRRKSWSRAVFSTLQRKGLEIQFQQQKYITKPDRRKLAARLNLSDSQVVKVWFQNRRMKWRRTRENFKSGQEKSINAFDKSSNQRKSALEQCESSSESSEKPSDEDNEINVVE